MATRARIGIENADGSITTSYHHWDGYPAGLGYNLLMNWNDKAKLRSAIELGDASNWGKRIAADGEHSFDSPEEDVNVYYGRDRGETDVGPKAYASYAVFEKVFMRRTPCGEDYAYVLRSDGSWTQISVYHKEVKHDAEDDIICARAAMLSEYKKRMAA